MLAGGTFAPKFIKSEEMQNAPQLVRGIDGENDFAGKRYVWLRHPEKAFVRGWVVEELEGNNLLVQCDDGEVRVLPDPLTERRLTSRTATNRRCRHSRQGQSG